MVPMQHFTQAAQAYVIVRAQCLIFIKSLLLAMPLIGNT